MSKPLKPISSSRASWRSDIALLYNATRGLTSGNMTRAGRQVTSSPSQMASLNRIQKGGLKSFTAGVIGAPGTYAGIAVGTAERVANSVTGVSGGLRTRIKTARYRFKTGTNESTSQLRRRLRKEKARKTRKALKRANRYAAASRVASKVTGRTVSVAAIGRNTSAGNIRRRYKFTAARRAALKKAQRASTAARRRS